MSLTRIHNLSISLDGFATGEPQSAAAPFGHAGENSGVRVYSFDSPRESAT
jgi:hypothetical protein